jgi:elongation factor 2 kinase
MCDSVVIQKRFREIIHRAAAKAVAEEDVWGKHNIHAIPAERVIRYQYNVENRQFVKDETIVKIEKEPFTNGAMRHCFRMKKLAMPPQSASNHRFHKYGWSRALNYVAKCYMEKGEIIVTKEGKDNVFTDVTLQYEAMHWAEKFNKSNPPKKIDFIRAYAIEFVDRPGKPVFAVERFIAGHDPYGNGFVKHNTNSGFVDLEEHRKTPQMFSAHSFYSSQGQRLVADIQGVGDMYTDPQVLSMDYRFGDGDLGPRGMALFFKTFCHCDISDSLGIPIFPLSRNEKKHQSKYSDDDSTCSEGSLLSKGSQVEGKCRFMQLDINRTRRKSILLQPTDVISDETRNTAKR